jgi:hypothetical protein
VDSIGQDVIFGFVGQSGDLSQNEKVTLGMGGSVRVEPGLALSHVLERSTGEIGDRTDECIEEGLAMEPSWDRQIDFSTPSDKPIELGDKK